MGQRESGFGSIDAYQIRRKTSDVGDAMLLEGPSLDQFGAIAMERTGGVVDGTA